jgi:hypothetical protein
MTRLRKVLRGHMGGGGGKFCLCVQYTHLPHPSSLVDPEIKIPFSVDCLKSARLYLR